MPLTAIAFASCGGPDPTFATGAGGEGNNATSANGGNGAGGETGGNGSGASSSGGGGTGQGGGGQGGAGGDGGSVPITCGDGTVDTAMGEECDLGTGNNSDTLPNTCRTNCLNPFCGDGVSDTGEQCDNGAITAPDGCSATCMVETLVPDNASGIMHLPGFLVETIAPPISDTSVRMSNSATFGNFMHVLGSNRIHRMLPDDSFVEIATFSSHPGYANDCGGNSYPGFAAFGFAFTDSPGFGENMFHATVNNSNPCEPVSRTTPAGVTTLLALGSNAGQGMSSPWSIAPSAGGAFGEYLYIAESGFGVLRVDPVGNLTVFNANVGGRGVRFGMDRGFGSDLYAADTSDDTIYRIDSGGSETAFSVGWVFPRSIAFSEGGTAWGNDMYVMDAGTSTPGTAYLDRVTAAGTHVTVASNMSVSDPGWGAIEIASSGGYCDAMYIGTYQSGGSPSALIVKITPPSPTCGDSVIDACEDCDPPGGACDASCRMP